MSFVVRSSLSLRKVLDVRNAASACLGISQKDSNEWSLQQRMAPQFCQQVREKRTRTATVPFWMAATTRVKYPEHITPENEEFLGNVVKEQYKHESPLLCEPWPRGEWAPKSQRCGLLGKKIGYQYYMWKKDGTRLITTLIEISDNHVIRYVPASELQKNDHYPDARISKKPRGALIVGSDSTDPRQYTREYYNMFEKAGVMPKKRLTKFLVTDNAILQPGTPLYATHFRPGDHVDIAGYSVDHGFQGVMKRWGFKGGPAAHGNTKSHRRPGYIGCGRNKVMPGHKQAGNMGLRFNRNKGSRILRINSRYNLIWVNGPVIGPVGGYVIMYDSGLFHHRYRDANDHPPFPTHYPAEHSVPEDWYADDIQPFDEGTITFQEEEAAAKK